MATSGPPKKIFAFRMLEGTDTAKARRDAQEEESAAGALDVTPFTEVPKPPQWLPNVHAVKEWKRLAPILVANKLLHEGNVGGFGQLCALHGKLTQLWAAGETPKPPLLLQYRQLINDYGLTPLAQARIKTGFTEASNKTNRFRRNGAAARRPTA